MATYAELYELRANSDLRNKVAVAVAVKAQTLLDAATPSNSQVAWANAAISNPNAKAEVLLNYSLAKNKAMTVVQINGAADATIQSAIDGAVDKLIAGGA
jgi:hypothetical protein